MIKQLQKVTTITALLLLLVISLKAQNITGTVIDEKGMPVPNVSVVAANEQGKAQQFCKTDKKGGFTLTIPTGRKVSQLMFVMVGFEKKQVLLSSFSLGQKIVMKEVVTELNEVTVKPGRMWERGDTVVYSVDGFREKQDRSIEDVIKRLPGLNVADNGQISYMGKNIRSFLVEGKDLTRDKYAQISRNLTADKVENVEVWRNYQPEKILQGKGYSDMVALNLVLNDKGKNSWSGTIEVGTGLSLCAQADWLQKSRIVGMFFGETMQSLFMLKTDNTGKDLMEEINPKGFISNFETGIIQDVSLRSASGAQSMSRFNNTQAFATNWLFQKKMGTELRVQVSGLLDKTVSEYSTQTIYSDIAGNTVTDETDKGRTKRRELGGEVTFNRNTSKILLTNTISGQINFNESSADTWLDGKNTAQRVKPRQRNIGNDLYLILRRGNNNISITSNLGYSYLPGTMLLFDGSDETVNINALNMTNKISLNHNISKTLSLSYYIEETSHLKKLFVEYTDTADNVKYHENLYSAGANIGYHKNMNNLSIGAKASLLDRELGSNKETVLKITPTATILWTIIPNLTLMSNYSYNISPNDFYSANPIRMYTRYNYIQQGTGDLFETTGQLVMSSLSYINTKKELTYRLSQSYYRTNAGQVYQSKLTDGVYSQNATKASNVMESNNIGASVGFPVRFWRMHVDLNTGYSWTSQSILLNGDVIPTGMKGLSGGMSLSFRPVFVLNITASSSINHNQSRGSLYGNGLGATTFYNEGLNIAYNPGNFSFQWKTDCQFGNANSTKSSIASSASAAYKTKAYEFSLSLTNIFGKSYYSQRYVTGASSVFSTTRLRPRELMGTVTFSL